MSSHKNLDPGCRLFIYFAATRASVRSHSFSLSGFISMHTGHPGFKSHFHFLNISLFFFYLQRRVRPLRGSRNEPPETGSPSFYCYLRIENAGRLYFDRRVFIYLFICMRVIRKSQKVLNRIA